MRRLPLSGGGEGARGGSGGGGERRLISGERCRENDRGCAGVPTTGRCRRGDRILFRLNAIGGAAPARKV